MRLYLCGVMDLQKRRAAVLLIECMAVGCLLIGCQPAQQREAQQVIEPLHAVVMEQSVVEEPVEEEVVVEDSAVAQNDEEYMEYYDLYEDVFGQDAELCRSGDSVAGVDGQL